MSTQIIKLKTNSNLKQAFSKIYHKFSNTNSQMTVIIKKGIKNEHFQLTNPKPSSTAEINNNQNTVIYEHIDEQVQVTNSHQHHHINQYQNQTQKLQSLCNIIGADENENNNNKQQFPILIKNRDFQSINDSFNICISTKLIFPNLQFTQRTDGRSKLLNQNKMVKSEKKNTIPLKKSNLNKSTMSKVNIPKFNQQTNKTEEEYLITSQFYQKAKQQRLDPLITPSPDVKRCNNRESSPNSFVPVLTKLSKKQISEKQDDFGDQSGRHSQQSSYMSMQQSIPESLFVVEDKLNDAISYIKMNKIFQLQEYLYQFKTKYNCISDRVEIKWRLLMAHCKQYRKEYDRASILYQQVLEMSRQSPKSLLIQVAQIYHRLGICYTQIRKWNDGIQSFAEALKGFQKSDKIMKYSQCMNNLGTLYLAAYQIEEAQQCFLISYQIKINQYANPSKLISSLLNLYECNLILHNYDQAEQVLKQAQKIIGMVKDNSMLSAGLQRRKGKLLFLRGQLQQAGKSYTKALQQIKKYPYSLQYGQLCTNMGVLKLQLENLVSARQLFEISLGILNFYYTKDSQQIKNIRSNLQLIEKLGEKTISCRIINSPDGYDRKDHVHQSQNNESYD